MQTGSQKNLFKFMAVRPVQITAPEDAALGFLRPPTEGRSEFSKSLERAKSWTEAQSLASTYIRTNGYPGSWGSSDPALAFLKQVHSALQIGAATGDLDGLKKAWKTLQPQAKTLKLGETRTRLWDTLLAAYFAPRVNPRDRGEIIQALRTLLFVDVADTLKGGADVVALLRATALLPAWCSRSKFGEKPAPTQAPKPASKVDMAQINTLRREVVMADEALDDLELSYAQASRSRQGTPAVRTSTGAVSVESDSRPLQTQVDQISTSFKPATVSYLDTLDRGWKLKDTQQVSASLENRRAELVNDLEKSGGRKASEGMKSRTAMPTRVSPDLQLEPLALDSGSAFEKSMEGSVGSVRPLGVGDLLVVEETLLGYREGEISYIENVMSTEHRERIHRQLDRVSTTTMTSTETTEETQRDLQSTERNEMAAEVQTTIRNDVSLRTGVNVSGGFGPVVQVDTSADFAVGNSTETSTANSSNFAQEVVDHTVSKLTQSMREQITQKVLTETEETNKHGFDNKSPNHVVGIYRWLEKVYKAQIVNYGKRLMMELVVPEPSAFYKFGRDGGAVEGMIRARPEPLPEDFGFQELTPSNYRYWVNRYRVSGVNPPPVESITTGKVLEIPETRHDPKGSDYTLTTKSDSIEVPEGYLAKEAWARGAWVIYSDQNENKQISGTKLIITVGRKPINKLDGDDYASLNDEERIVPVGVVAYNVAAYTINVEVRSQRKNATLAAWQMETYKRIVDAYNSLQTAYDAELEAKRVAQSSALTKISPDAKRGVEQVELKRACLELITGQYFFDFDATRDSAKPFGYPEFLISQAMEEGAYSQFFEQCFEWEQMTYAFYPYYWGRKSQWVDNSTETDDDPVFESFLRAGSSRVLLPVRPGYALQVLYYLNTGEFWNGGEAPAVDEELQAAIAMEAASAQDVSLSGGRPYGKPWTYTLPTSLVKLQADATLPSWPQV